MINKIIRRLERDKSRRKLTKGGQTAYDRLEWTRNVALSYGVWSELVHHLHFWLPEAFNYGKSENRSDFAVLCVEHLELSEAFNVRLREPLEELLKNMYQLGSTADNGEDLRIIVNHLSE